MKIDRQIGILSLLLQKDKMTANELAEKFEVSRRTIVRDIEDLNRAGIPIVAMQGKNGGISIMENYKMDRTVLSSSEMQAILAGLQSLDSVSESRQYRQLMEKLSVKHTDSINADNHVIIDLSMWDKSAVSDKIALIKSALEEKEQIAFSYFSPNGESSRIIEPYHLIFQWSNWYVWGYCTEKCDYRMFKLMRMTNLRRTGEKCAKRKVPEYTCDKFLHTKGEIAAVVRFDKSVKWRLIDEWGSERCIEDEDGNLTIRFTWSDVPSFYSWILTFGDHAEILEPEEYRKGFADLVKSIQRKYEM